MQRSAARHLSAPHLSGGTVLFCAGESPASSALRE